jgi:hypothetical protein
MRIVGIDLAVRAQHRAIIANEQSRFMSSIIKFKTQLVDLDRLNARARQDMAADEELVVVMEATNIVWYPVSVYFLRRGATVCPSSCPTNCTPSFSRGRTTWPSNAPAGNWIA